MGLHSVLGLGNASDVRTIPAAGRYQALLDMTADRRLVVVPTFQTWVLEYAVEAAEGVQALPGTLRCNGDMHSRAMPSHLLA